jgi:Tfp pilus assembly protein PilO
VIWLFRPDRLWMFGALAGAVALSALAWFLLIGPQRAETGSVEEQTAGAQGQEVVERRKLARLNADFADRDRFAAELAANRRALPTVAGTGDLLRELQSAGESAGVSVTSLTAGTPAGLKDTASVASMTITIAATGRMIRLQAFLTQVQRIQPRAMLVFSLAFVPDESGGPITDTAQLSLSAQVFVSIPVAAVSSAPASPTTGD